MVKKGQASTEYLVILAIVLVIALVVVYLIGGFSGMGTETVETQSKQVWASAAPLSITSWKQSGTSMQLVVQNNDVDTITLTGVSMDGGSVYSGNTSIVTGNTAIVTVTSASTCGSAGTSFSHQNVTFVYNKGSLSGLVEVGAKPIVGKCS